MKSSHLLSIVGTGSAEIGALTLGNFSKGAERHQPHCVRWGQSSYLVGEHVIGNARPLDRLDMQQLSEGPGTRALTYSTLGMLLEPGSHSARIMVGFPVEVLEDDLLAERALRVLRSWLEGTQSFTFDDQQYEVEITRVNVLPQPAGAYFAWGLDDHGEWQRGTDALESPVGICDIGYNTLDVFAVQGGRVLREYTRGDTAGMRRAIKHLRRVIADRHNVEYSRPVIDRLLRSPRSVIHTADGTFEIGELVEEARGAAAGGVLAFLEDDANWGNARQFRHTLFTGGGADALRDALLAGYPHAHIMPEPVMANALGLARYLRMIEKQELVISLDPGFGGFKAVLL